MTHNFPSTYLKLLVEFRMLEILACWTDYTFLWQIVFVGPYEHHSNLLPWRELGSTVIQIIETGEGLVDLNELRVQLQVSLPPASEDTGR